MNRRRTLVLLAGALALTAPSKGAAGDPAGASAGAAGDPRSGKALFVGARRLANAGAPCGACHAIAGHGPALAATLGPDLTHTLDGMPAEAADGLLQDLPFPTMAPIYAAHPLTPAERADLAAFMAQASEAAPPDATRFAAWAGAVAAFCLAGMAFAARGRKRPTRAGLTARSRGARR